MQVLGNIDLLKKEIEKTYSEKLNDFKKEKTEEFNREKIELAEQHQSKLKKIKAELKNEERKVYRTALAEEKLNAKKEFESKREKMINQVFDTAKERSKDNLLSEDYISFIKEFVKEKKGIDLVGGYEEYKKTFPEIVINPKITGIIGKQGNNVFDFTHNTFIKSKKLDLRHEISRILFEKNDN